MSPTLRANQVSAQREPVSALAQGKIPEIGKRRSETGPRNRAGKRLNPPLNERGDAFTRRKPLTLRPFHENRRKSPQARNAWLGREDSNLRMAESKSAALPLGDAPSFAGVAPARAIPIRRLALLRNMLVASFRAAPPDAIDLSLQFRVSCRRAGARNPAARGSMRRTGG